MKKQIIAMTISAMASGVVFAAGTPVANQFVAGQPARAAEVNANFQELADRVDVNGTAIETNAASITTNATAISTNTSGVSTNAAAISTNADDISTNADGVATNAVGVSDNASDISTNASDISTNESAIADNAADIDTNATSIASIESNMAPVKTLNVDESLVNRVFIDQNPDNANNCDRREDTFEFNTEAKTFHFEIELKNSSDLGVCGFYEYDFSYSGSLKHDGFYWNNNGTDYAWEYSTSEVLLPAKFPVGSSWGEYIDRAISANGGEASNYGGMLAKKTALGYQNVDVPYGSYEDCLVVHEEKSYMGSDTVGGVLYFYCSETGLTRIVDLVGNKDWQLTSRTNSQ